MIKMAPWQLWGGSKRGILRPTILALLKDNKMTGTEIMDKIQEMSGGWWRPSPGSIYPLLNDMLKEGLLSADKDGKYGPSKKYAEKTELSGFSNILGVSSTSMEDNLQDMESFVSYMEDINRKDPAEVKRHKTRIKTIMQRLSKFS